MTGGDQLSLVDATFVVSAASSVGSAKKTNRYTTNFRADLADALNVNAAELMANMRGKNLERGRLSDSFLNSVLLQASNREMQ